MCAHTHHSVSAKTTSELHNIIPEKPDDFGLSGCIQMINYEIVCITYGFIETIPPLLCWSGHDKPRVARQISHLRRVKNVCAPRQMVYAWRGGNLFCGIVTSLRTVAMMVVVRIFIWAVSTYATQLLWKSSLFVPPSVCGADGFFFVRTFPIECKHMDAKGVRQHKLQQQ